MHGSSDAHALWRIAVTLCDSFGPSHSSVKMYCGHGVGHGMLRSALRDLYPAVLSEATRCTSFTFRSGIYALKTILRGAALCFEAPSPQHAFLSADGLFDDYFERNMGLYIDQFTCDMLPHLQSSCYWWSALLNSSTSSLDYNRCSSPSIRSEAARLGCFFAYGRLYYIATDATAWRANCESTGNCTWRAAFELGAAFSFHFSHYYLRPGTTPRLFCQRMNASNVKICEDVATPFVAATLQDALSHVPSWLVDFSRPLNY